MLSHVLITATILAVSTLTNAQRNESCTAPGMMCKTCDELAVCVSTSTGVLKQWTVSTCPSGSCRNGRCVPGAKCNYRPFTCSENGSFPDPYDCGIFHLCSNGNPFPRTVSCEGTAYNSTTNYCTFSVAGNPDCIDGPVPKCEKNLQIGALERNPNIYYICTENENSIAANLFKCPPTTIFNSSTFECVAKPQAV